MTPFKPPALGLVSGLVFDLLPSKTSASSMMMMPPAPLLAHNSNLRSSEGPWLLRGKT